MDIPFDIHSHKADPLSGKNRIISLSVGAKDWQQTIALPEIYPMISIGLHPWHVDADWEKRLYRDVEPLISQKQIIAIGETGLDWLHGGERNWQEKAFCMQIQLAEHYAKPLIIHCVKAIDLLLSLRRRFKPEQTWVIHGFRGKAEQARMLVNQGICLSFGEHFNPDALKACPADMLFLESDESKLSIEEIYSRAANTLGRQVEDLVAQIRINLSERLIGNGHRNSVLMQ